QEIYARLPVVRQLEAEIAERSVACAKKLLEGDKSVLDRLKEDLKDLREQKALIIRAAGYPDDYLELHYRCPDCRDTGLIDGRKCHCFLQAQMKLLHAQSNLEDVLERENFKALSYEYYDDTEILPQLGITNAAYMRRVVAGCREFVRDFDKKHDNLLFTGSTGVGKTFLTNCIARELMDDFHSVIYLTASDLFDVFSRNKFDYDNAEDMKDMYRFILDCDLLIIDDLGTELNNSFTSSQLFYCINERMNMSRSTIISTNLTLARLRDSYTDRVTSRIMSGYRIIPLYGGDIRLLKK
ncbi:MAG: ATP-binding protein, partial [Enterocloster bolteae]